MKLNILPILMLVLMFSACNISNNDEGIVLSTSSENLIIENNFDVKIYYNVMDNECAPYTDWGVFADVNVSIKAGDSKRIKFKDIYTDKDRSLLNGDKVEVSWWNDEFIDEKHVFGYNEVGKSNGTERIIL